MTHPEDKPNKTSNQETKKEIQTQPEKPPAEIRQERITQINQELNGLNYQATSSGDIQQIQKQREKEYQSEITKLEQGLGIQISDESKDIIHKNIVDSVIKQAQQENERFDRLHIQKTILENIENENFRRKISPTKFENLTEKAFEKALEQLLEADIDLPKNERIKLFRQTLEYYAYTHYKTKLPIWHSTSSYTLRKGLEEGFAGGHGDYSGEHSYLKDSKKFNYKAQQPLSISYSNHPASEINQQIYAKLSCRKEDLPKYMPIDYEKITDSSLVVDLINILKKHDLKGLKRIIALNKKMDIREITDEEALQFEIPKHKIKLWKTERTHAPKYDEIKKKILPNINNQKLKKELSQEAQHPFPCFITFEADNLKYNLTKFSRGKHEAHLPYEDHYWGNLPSSQIREIRVPQNQIKKVKKWLKQKGLLKVNVVPIEVYEIKRLIEHNI